MDGLAEILLWVQGVSGAATLVLVRVGGVMALLPAFGEQVVPSRIKLGATIAFTLIIAPIVLPLYPPELSQPQVLGMLAPEIVAGLAIGILFRLFIITLQIAGTIAAQSTSLSLIFGAGVGAEPQPTFATLLVMAGLCLAVIAGLHVYAVQALILSYEIFEPGQIVPSLDLYNWGVDKITSSFALGFTLAGPFVLISVTYNLGLGVINRAMPQLMVAFVGAPAISFAGIVMLMIAAPFLLDVWKGAFEAGVDFEREAF